MRDKHQQGVNLRGGLIMPNFNKDSRYFFALLLIVWLLTSAGCLKKVSLSSNNSLSSASVIFLAQAQFRNEIGEDGQAILDESPS